MSVVSVLITFLNCKQQKWTLVHLSRRGIYWNDIRKLKKLTWSLQHQSQEVGRNKEELSSQNLIRSCLMNGLIRGLLILGSGGRGPLLYTTIYTNSSWQQLPVGWFINSPLLPWVTYWSESHVGSLIWHTSDDLPTRGQECGSWPPTNTFTKEGPPKKEGCPDV